MPGLTGLSAIQPIPFGGGAGGCDFELLARFTADDQGYSNGQVLDTEAEGVEMGILNVVEVDGTIALAGNKCTYTPQGTPAWGDLGLYGAVAANTLGKLIGGVITISSGDNILFGWAHALGVAQTDMEFAAWLSSGNQLHYYADNLATKSARVGTWATDADYEIAIVNGGYAAPGEPWYSGAGGTFNRGAALFIRGGDYADWTLLWKFPSPYNTPLVAALSNYNAAGAADNIRIPIHDYSLVHQPNNCDWFVDDNGTLLDAHTPDVGGGWTVHWGTWQIQSNRAYVSAAPAANNWATVDALADGLLRITARSQVGTGSIGLLFRMWTSISHWKAIVNFSTSQFELVEVVGGVPTVRDFAAISPASNTDYEITVILDGQDIQAYLNGGYRLHHTSSNGQTALPAGPVGTDVADDYDNFHVQPRVGAQYDILDRCL